MGKYNSEKIKVGIFVLVGTILLVAALYLVGKKQHLFTDNIKLYAVFANVNGLQIGNNVRYSGVDVGTVSNIEMIEEGKIKVEMLVEEETSHFIKKDATASIASDGLVGSMVVNILPGKDETAKIVKSGDTIRTSKKISIDEMLDTLSKTNENAALLTSDLVKITNKILDGQGTIGSLLNDTLMIKDIRQSVAELKTTATGTSEAIGKVNTIISKINYDQSAAAVFLSDKNSADQIKNVFSNLEKSSKEINLVTKNLDDYMLDIKSGKGTLNHIANDPVLVKNIDSTVVSVKQAAEKLNENMEALKHNFLFRGYFRKLEKQKEKEALKK
ncbi:MULTISPECIES: MlaD family protein [unclassified Kaistella]|uniref:MlaD family protein n=1 Tax=unclassified Kaistella TaxID=2762626 RepID=UPI0027361CB8|nr:MULTISPECIES: MlaD family protein [unclassified Kaistella]MDP2453473.1 MlaD family protein [Kaistella sp. SH11-4b]MDP2456530.1 MlaD family protein [Kaistella sp. SH40-3]MDP2459286.1 MlaD family protein [Kaistella sp. SH19-2b]